MPKPGPAETAGLRVPAWSLKDQPKDQKFPHPSGKTPEKKMGTWQPWIFLPAPPENSRKKQLLYCSRGCERTRLEVYAHFCVPPALPGDPLSGASLQDSSWKGICVWGAIFLRIHLVKRKSMRSSENPRIRGALCRITTWEGLSQRLLHGWVSSPNRPTEHSPTTS